MTDAAGAVLALVGASLNGRYATDREIGRGGMARVYHARDLRHDRDVAIKVLDPQRTLAIGAERFRREIQLTARLTHPHIIPVLDSGQAGELLYYVTPFAAGESLRARLDRDGQLPGDSLTATGVSLGTPSYMAPEQPSSHPRWSSGVSRSPCRVHARIGVRDTRQRRGIRPLARAHGG